MKTRPPRPRRAFTLVEVMVSMSIAVLAIGLTLSTFLFGLRIMYKDTQRLATNASLRSFMAQISKETLDASYFYVFDHYSRLDGNVDLNTDYATINLDVDETGTDYDKWTSHGDCVVLVTNTSLTTPTKIRQVRVYYRRTSTQAEQNADAPLRYYETADWGTTGRVDGSGDPVDLATILNEINLSASTTGANYNSDGTVYNSSAGDFAGSKLLALKTRGRAVPAPYTGYTAGDRYPVFSSESPSATPSTGYISINVEFVSGSTVNNLLSSSSFNYTISPRR